MQSSVTRRQFLERASLAAAALPLIGQGTATAASMFVSLPPWAVARNVGWPEQARLAARLGYGGIDWAFGAAREAGVDATRALFQELKIEPTIVNLPMQSPLDVDEAAFKAQLPKLDEDAAFCQAVGCSRFQFVLRPTTGGPTKEERWQHVTARLGAISEVVGRHGMRVGLEFLGPLVFRTRVASGRRGAGADPAAPPPAPPVPFVWTLAETVKLAAASGPHIGVTLDAWHWYHSQSTVDDILAAPAERIVHVHVSDAKPMPPEQVEDNMRWLPGEGVIDLVGFFKALDRIGYRGGVAPETIGARIPDTMAPEESARLALEATRLVMRKAGLRVG